MASSRWKRFAFFDRHTLPIPSDVIDDIARSEDWSMAVSTAGLRLRNPTQQQSKPEDDPLQAMWTSLTACAAPMETEGTLELSSQAQVVRPGKNDVKEGLVLVFCASARSQYIHCFDLTIRCSTRESSEDMDGWRGYWPVEGGVKALDACRGNGDKYQSLLVACITSANEVCLWKDPHVHLSCRRPLAKPVSPVPVKSVMIESGAPSSIAVAAGLVAVGTETGEVLVYTESMRLYLKIPAPTSPAEVASLQLSSSEDACCVFVGYKSSEGSNNSGLCCFDLPLPTVSNSIAAPLSRHDLDGRYVGSSSMVDSVHTEDGFRVTVARPDGLYSYSSTERISVAPIDGAKTAIGLIPPTDRLALVASKDTKSGRDTVDVYDATNKLVASHLLLSPGHQAVCAAGIRNAGRSSAIVLTSGGAFLSLTEKDTSEKISLLTQKNLYAAAIVIAFSDPSMEPSAVVGLYRQYAEHLYLKGDFAGSMEQYIHTIGSLESSHVVFRFLDAPKIPLLVQYLEKLRERDLATPIHKELLRTCYLKLNDSEAAEALVSSADRVDENSLSSLLSNLAQNPKEALATICSLEASQAAEVLVVHGASLARTLPRETAGVTIALCVGTYSPEALAAAVDAADLNKMIEYATDDREKACAPYPVDLFASAFIEHPKLLRLVLAHCNRNKCPLSGSLRRTLLELSLAEWNQAKRSGDTEVEKARYKEAITALTDSHCRDIGDYDSLVVCQLAGFEDGELLLYERLQMTPLLLERYARDASEKSRRQMLALCQTDPEILADVLGHFVNFASEEFKKGSDHDTSQAEEILQDIEEALSLARRQGVLPPVRIARILAGEGPGQFSAEDVTSTSRHETVPLSVAIDYIGTILEESSLEIGRLTSEVEEYDRLCNSMEEERDALLRAAHVLPAVSGDLVGKEKEHRLNIDEWYARVRLDDGESEREEGTAEQPREAFWRAMNQGDDTFDTISRFFAKGVIS